MKQQLKFATVIRFNKWCVGLYLPSLMAILFFFFPGDVVTIHRHTYVIGGYYCMVSVDNQFLFFFIYFFLIKSRIANPMFFEVGLGQVWLV